MKKIVRWFLTISGIILFGACGVIMVPLFTLCEWVDQDETTFNQAAKAAWKMYWEVLSDIWSFK